MSQLLTDDEHELIGLLGDAYTRYCAIVGDGRARAGDIAEFAHRVHDLQHAVMAQAAARAYPRWYRLAGEAVLRDE